METRHYLWGILSLMSLVGGGVALRYAPPHNMFVVVSGLAIVAVLSAMLAFGFGERKK